MKDLNGVEIDYDNEELFPLDFMLPKINHLDKKISRVEYVIKGEDEDAEDMAEFMRSTEAILK